MAQISHTLAELRAPDWNDSLKYNREDLASREAHKPNGQTINQFRQQKLAQPTGLKHSMPHNGTLGLFLRRKQRDGALASNAGRGEHVTSGRATPLRMEACSPSRQRRGQRGFLSCERKILTSNIKLCML